VSGKSGFIAIVFFRLQKYVLSLLLVSVLGRFFYSLGWNLGKVCIFAPSSIVKNMEGYKKCPYCGEEIPESATKCMYCTAWLSGPQSEQPARNEGVPPQQPRYQGATPTTNVYVNATPAQAMQPQPVRQKNGPGSAGLVLSILGLVLCWVPIANLILWFLGFLFSFIGVFKRPRGKAIAGLIISVITVIVLVCLVALGAAVAGSEEISDLFEELFY
jgi:hypothetical protein